MASSYVNFLRWVDPTEHEKKRFEELSPNARVLAFAADVDWHPYEAPALIGETITRTDYPPDGLESDDARLVDAFMRHREVSFVHFDDNRRALVSFTEMDNPTYYDLLRTIQQEVFKLRGGNDIPAEPKQSFWREVYQILTGTHRRLRRS